MRLYACTLLCPNLTNGTTYIVAYVEEGKGQLNASNPWLSTDVFLDVRV